MKNMEQLFEKIDVLATPCTGNGTWKICEEDSECEFYLQLLISKANYNTLYHLRRIVMCYGDIKMYCFYKNVQFYWFTGYLYTYGI